MKKERTNLFKNTEISESQNFNSIKITLASTEKIKSCVDALNAEWSKVSQDLYKTEQQSNPSNEPETSNDGKNEEDNVENVDYEVVDDDKDK